MKMFLSLLAFFALISGIITQLLPTALSQLSNATYSIEHTDNLGGSITNFLNTTISETQDEVELDEALSKLMKEHEKKLIEIRLDNLAAIGIELQNFQEETALLLSKPWLLMDQQAVWEHEQTARKIQKKTSYMADISVCSATQREIDPTKCDRREGTGMALRSQAAQLEDLINDPSIVVPEKLKDNMSMKKPPTVAQEKQMNELYREMYETMTQADIVVSRSPPCTSYSRSQCQIFVFGIILRAKRLSESIMYAEIDLGCPKDFPDTCSDMKNARESVNTFLEKFGSHILDLL